MNCQWAQALTRFDCRPVPTLDGKSCLEIGTPFSLPDGSAINLYLVEHGSHIRVSDNGDTLFQLSSMGLDVWQPQRFAALRAHAAVLKLHLENNGELFTLASADKAAAGFAVAMAGLIGISHWAAEKMGETAPEVDLAAKLQPFIVARNPSAVLERNFKVQGASRVNHRFDFRHGNDLIDVIPANAISTGGVMRKVGDVINGPFCAGKEPLIIVDDSTDPDRAASEIGILSALTRAMPASTLMRPKLH